MFSGFIEPRNRVFEIHFQNLFVFREKGREGEREGEKQ